MKNNSKPRFTEMATAKISDTRNLVISETQTGTFVMAQQLEVQEGKKKHNIFMQGAIEITSLNGLYELRDAINVCIHEVESKIPHSPIGEGKCAEE